MINQGGNESDSRELKEILEFCFQNILKRMNSSAPDTRFVGEDVEVVAESVEAGFGESEISAERSDQTVSSDERGIVEQYERKAKRKMLLKRQQVENIEKSDTYGEEEEEAQEMVEENSEVIQLDANKLGERFIVKRTRDFPNNDGVTWELVGKRKQQYFFRKFACTRRNCEGEKKIRMFGNHKRRCSTPNHKMEVV